MKTLLMGLLAATVLVANAQSQNTSTRSSKRMVYRCENGMTATVRYSKNQARIYLDTAQKTATLKQAVSGSGSRYTNNKGFYGKASEWHVKGKEAMLTFSDPYHNEVNTVCIQK